ncbi:excitatory amino acid transporter 1-like isoform X2 [Lycorma delicatula]|uniref:excitatory amino acid transporter 1-like isoform X2 n=1 Tax=Lycorma delicatula TaxID=130591 RepID=UPI003F518D67
MNFQNNTASGGTDKMAKTKQKKSFILENLLTILTVVGVFGGTAFGLILRSVNDKWKARDIMYVNFVGDLFLRMLKGLIIPLLVCSIVSSVGALDLSLSKKIGMRAILWYVCTTLLAVTQGIILVLTIQPGKGNTAAATKTTISQRNVLTTDTILDLVRNMFPDNIAKACISQYRTLITPPKDFNTTDLTQWDINSEYIENSNILGLVVFSIIMGIAIGQLGAAGVPVLKFFESLGDVTMLMTTWVIWMSPLGVFFLVSSKILETESFSLIMSQLGLYFVTVLTGLIIHGYVLLPFLYFLFTRKSPIIFLRKMSQAIITAFGTASSNATLPVSMQCIEEKCGIDVRISRFVMPIGATINMDGTALYEAVAAIFIAQIRNVPLSFGHVIAVSITATMASIGAAGIPQAGLVTMVMVLDTVGLPAEDVTIIFAVDWLLDRFRTAVNVSGDGLGAGVVAHLSQGDLEDMTDMPMSLKTYG